METIHVSLGDRGYPIILGEGAIGQLPAVLAERIESQRIALVTDSNVAPLYSGAVTELIEEAGGEPTLCVVPAGEEHKRLAAIDDLCGQFIEAGLDRGSLVIALGGGVLGDIAGFAAAAYMRGVPHIQIPTTLVAQVDSSVGGKTGVNHALAKNIIGAFHQPAAVIADTTFLKSLPPRELRAGLAEVIKHGIIADAGLFTYMEEEAERILEKDLDALLLPVRRSCEIKAQVVEADEREGGLRAILNYGHTFGHGIEAASNYTTFLHGEAVALGMHAAGCLSWILGLVDDAFVDRQQKCLEAYGLPTQWPEIPVEEVLAAMKRDKKSRGGTLRFVVADRIGHVTQRTDVSEEQARRALTALAP